MYEPSPRLGRLHSVDINDQRYLLWSINPQAASAAADIEHRYHFTDLVIDQGDTSACVGAASRGWLSAGPVRNMTGPSWLELYHSSQLLDEWPGVEPAYYGTSVRAAFKVLKAQGFVKSYGWAFDADTAINHVLLHSPLILGTSWFDGMMSTDKQGFIHADGRDVGGHAYLMVGASRTKKCPDGSVGAARILNSWSAKWGQSGRAWLSFKDLDALIRDHGEAATAFEQKVLGVTTGPVIQIG